MKHRSNLIDLADVDGYSALIEGEIPQGFVPFDAQQNHRGACVSPARHKTQTAKLEDTFDD